ncbi:MAG: hypothetical protein WC412_07970 [Candidatus Omnitrophota bacterium]|jgi:hypothetical protein
MEKFLFKIRKSWVHKDDGITVTPGVESKMVNVIVGAKLTIRKPDGNIHDAYVSKLSPLCQNPDERIALCLSDGINIEDVPEDSEVYLSE